MFGRRKKRKAADDAHDARLREAEGNLRILQARGAEALRQLDSRSNRNHWRESIEHMIRGGA